MLELLKNRRSIRQYQDRKVEQEKVDLLTKGALLAPSAKNQRPLEFVVVDDKAKLEKLALTRQGGAFIKNAPLAIVVLADSQKSDVWVEDASIAATILHLGAAQLGLGSCWVQIRNRPHNDERTAGDYVKEVLQVPEGLMVEAIVAIGYPNEEKAPYTEADLLTEKLHYNQY